MAESKGTNVSTFTNRVEAYSKGDDSDKDRRLAAYWKDELDKVDDEWRRFVKRGRTIEKRYRDERNRVDEEGQRRYNLLWANVQTWLPALYAKAPLPVAERRFRDKDPVGRGAAQILERALRNEIEINGYHEALENAVLDYLLCGRGTVWVRYEPEIEESVSIPTGGDMEFRDAQGIIEPMPDDEEDEKLRETGDRIIEESIPIDYVPWTDFFIFPAKARTWKEVTAVGKRVYMTREEMIKRFGQKVGKAIPLEKDDRERRRQNESVVPDEEADHKGQVFEIWCRTDKTVYWVAEGYDELADKVEDPLGLKHFFPVPKPLFANPTTNTLVPVADYVQYQDQAVQIDELTQRISMLSKACKVAGVYNAASDGIKRLLDESVENELIPVDAWAAFAEKGGIPGNISFLPLKEIMGVLQQLQEVREKTISEADILTGMSDLMRGTSDARETLGGQRIKSNTTGTRLSKRQSDVARFARDTVRLMAEVLSIHFTPKSIIDASGALYEQGLGDIDPDDLMQQMQTLGPQGPAGGGAPAVPSPTPGAPAPNQLPPPGMPARPPMPPSGPGPQSLPPGAPGIPGPGGPMPPRPGIPPQGGGPVPGQAAPGPPQPGLPVPVQLGQPPVPGQPPGMPPQMPQLPPALMAKIEGLKRIAKAVQLIRDEAIRGFRVDIEVDSTIIGDLNQDKADRTEFLTMVTNFMEKAFQIGAMVPEAAPLMGKFLQFGVRGFKISRDLESSIEDFCDQMEALSKKMAAQKQNQPNPEAIKLQTEQVKANAQLQSTQMKVKGDQIKAQGEQQKQQLESQGEQVNAQADLQQAQQDVQQRQLEMEIEKIRLQIELAKLQAASHKAQADQHTAQVDAHTRMHEANLDSQTRTHEANMDHHARVQEAQQPVVVNQQNPMAAQQGGLGGAI